MGKGPRIAILVIVVFALLVAGLFLLGFEQPAISVSAEPIAQLGPLPLTNALFTSWVVTILIIIGFVLGTRKMKLVPSGWQNFLEMAVETLYNITEQTSGKKWASRFFLIPATIFFYTLVSNWFGLLPGLAAFGPCHAVHSEEAAQAEEIAHEESSRFRLPVLGCQEGEEIIPLFRAPSSDLNMTGMMAVVTQVTAWTFGFAALGLGGYLGKFFNFKGVFKAFGPDEHGQRRGCGGTISAFFLGLIEVFVGLLEFISEFGKIIAFMFRLFGNVFAGEVMLLVLTSLVPLFLTLPFLGLEVFVGAIQAFVFFILSVAFYTVAVTSHDHDEAHH
ncbi:MAG: F0F1 ATP synthase subunit A [Anaerolineae bacterium]